METNEPLLPRIALAVNGYRYRHTYTHIGRIVVPLLSRVKSLVKKSQPFDYLEIVRLSLIELPTGKLPRLNLT